MLYLASGMCNKRPCPCCRSWGSAKLCRLAPIPRTPRASLWRSTAPFLSLSNIIYISILLCRSSSLFTFLPPGRPGPHRGGGRLLHAVLLPNIIYLPVIYADFHFYLRFYPQDAQGLTVSEDGSFTLRCLRSAEGPLSEKEVPVLAGQLRLTLPLGAGPDWAGSSPKLFLLAPRSRNFMGEGGAGAGAGGGGAGGGGGEGEEVEPLCVYLDVKKGRCVGGCGERAWSAKACGGQLGATSQRL